MKRVVMVTLIVALVGAMWMVGRPLNAQTESGAEGAAEAPAAEAPAVQVDMEQVSYALGVDIGRRLGGNFADQDIDISNERLVAGFEAGLSGEGVEMSDEQINATIQSFQMAMMQKQQESMMKESDDNLAEGRAFLAENAKKEGVQTTDSGLQYQILEAGEGDPPKVGDDVTVHYRGELIDGTMFDSSKEPPQPGREPGPTTFTLGQVIPGWNEGLGLIGEGGKIRLYIPPDLAYGQQGAGQAIGPNQTLVFDVELLEINRAQEGDNADAGNNNELSLIHI